MVVLPDIEGGAPTETVDEGVSDAVGEAVAEPVDDGVAPNEPDVVDEPDAVDVVVGKTVWVLDAVPVLDADSDAARKPDVVDEAVREAVVDGVTAWQTSPIPSPLSRGTASDPDGQSRTHEPLPAGQIPLRMAGLGSSVGGSSA